MPGLRPRENYAGRRCRGAIHTRHRENHFNHRADTIRGTASAEVGSEANAPRQGTLRLERQRLHVQMGGDAYSHSR